ncbi:MAG: DMT family transporter [Candidatus Riflebacteria bacterium]|nr:DMT family transporter [Candidatus Riflebacteria bacterium]
MNYSLACVLVALCGILRSTDLYFRNPIIASLPVVVLIAWEHLINLAVVSPIFWLKRKQFRLLVSRDVFFFLMIGFGASAMGVLCFTEAFRYINPALAVLMQKLQPVMTITLGVILLREKVSRHFFAWAALAIICSYFVSFGFADPFTGEWRKSAIGAALAVAAAFFWGSGTVWGKLLLQKYDQSFVLACRFLLGAVFSVTLALVIHGGLKSDLIISEQLYKSIFYMAVISGVLATSFFYAGLKWVKASLASVLELFFPVSSVVIMWLSFNRPISWVQIVAAIVMFYAVFKINQLSGQEKQEN